MRVQLPTSLTLLTVLLCGCGAERAEFSNREEINDLIPEAQAHVRWVLDGNGDPEFPGYFGTPIDMVAWEKLPIKYHAAMGTLTDVKGAVADDSPGATLGVDLTTQNMPIAPGDSVTFISGEYEGATVTVEAFTPETGLLTIQEQGFQTAPAVGDQIVIGRGKVIANGRVLYAEHCQHCHGVSGDGNGPTAKYLNPRPRDYRKGLFKFTSTQTSDKAQRDDLSRTIWEGIPGTYMPSFKLLTDQEMQSIVEYVLWLSMRGEVENGQIQTLNLDYSNEALQSAIDDARESPDGPSANDVRQEFADNFKKYLAEDWQDEFDDSTSFLVEQWENAQLESAIVFPKVARVPDTPESRERGRLLFSDAKTKCDTCHGPQGLGDGGQTRSVQKDTATNSDYPLPGLYDNWGNPLKPRNLTRGIYRGGRRPIDLYRRLYAGIKGTPMPPFGTVLKDEEIWDLVNYVYSIPFEARESKPGEGGRTEPAGSAEVAATHVPADPTN